MLKSLPVTSTERSRLDGWRFNLAASTLAFCTYFSMYAFRKPFAAATYDAAPWLGLDLKTLYVISQVIGYTASKYIGIKWVSEVTRGQRLVLLLGLIGAAELALLGFALLPTPGKVVAIFANGLPLGMVWGLAARLLQIRQLRAEHRRHFAVGARRGLLPRTVLERAPHGALKVGPLETRTAKPAMAEPLLRLGAAWKQRAGNKSIRQVVIHRESRAPVASGALAPGVQALSLQDFLPASPLPRGSRRTSAARQ